jgi:uncharacterized membrane protein YgcG
MRKLRADTLALLALAAVSAGSASGSGCSTTRPTELVPAVLSQVVVPHDLQSVRVTVFANGKTSFDQAYDVGPNGTVELPSTLGVVSGEASSTVVRITVRGYEKPCAESNDCNDQTDNPVGTMGSRILRRSVQTFVDQRTLFVPMPLSYSCWNHDCGIASNMTCKGNTCVDGTRAVSELVDFDPSLVDGTGVCFSPKLCFDEKPEGGTSLSVAPLLVDASSCLYEYPAPAPVGLNVRAYFQNFAWKMDTGGHFQPVLQSGGEQEILNEDPVEGFTLVSTPDAGPGAGAKGSLFKLAPGLCELVTAASNPPKTPANGGAATYITISNLRASPVCPPKTPLLPICKGELTNDPLLPNGVTTTSALMCNVGVPMAPTQSALYLVMDQSQVMHGAFGLTGSATALSLSLSDPVFKRTSAAFTFLPGQASDCTNASTAFTMPDIDFGLAGAVQTPIAAKLKGWTAPDTAASPNPLELQAAMRLDAGAYKHLTDFLVGKELPNIAAAMFFVNRAPDATNDCNPPLGGQTTVQAALESEIRQAFDATPSLQTYFVVLDDDAHDSSTPTGALTFFKKIQTDLPQAVQVLDATQTNTMMAAQTAAANFAKIVTQLGTCVYDYGLPANADPTKVEVAFTVPGHAQTVVPLASACAAATQDTVNGWNLDNGRLRICGSSCNDLRQGILAASAAALAIGQPAPDLPVTATILCSGSGPVNDAGPSAAAGDDGGGSSSGGDGSAGSSSGSSGGSSGSGSSSGGAGDSGGDSSTASFEAGVADASAVFADGSAGH